MLVLKKAVPKARPDDQATPLRSFPIAVDRNRWRLWVKDESSNPTGTFKDRLAAGLVRQLHGNSLGNRLMISCITLGNTVRSLGHYVSTALRSQEQPQILGFFPLGFRDCTIGPDTSGDTITGDELLKWCSDLGVRCEEVDLTSRYLDESDIRQLARGLGLIFDEHWDVSYGIGEQAYAPILAEALARMPTAPHRVYVPVGAGVLFKECVELVEAWNLAGTTVVGVTVVKADSIADKIYGYYSPYFKEIKQQGAAHHPRYSRHSVITVTDEEIREALTWVAEMGIDAEPSAAAAFVPVMAQARYCSEASWSAQEVLIINTGNGMHPS
jgi:threonine dehydratase